MLIRPRQEINLHLPASHRSVLLLFYLSNTEILRPEETYQPSAGWTDRRRLALLGLSGESILKTFNGGEEGSLRPLSPRPALA